MITQHAQRFSRRAAPRPTRDFQRQNLNRAVHADGKDLFDLSNIGIDRPMFDIGAKAANRGLDHLAIVRVRPDLTWQAEKLQRALQRQGVSRPALGQAGPVRLGLRLGRLTALDIGAKAARTQRNLVARRILTQNAAINGTLLVPGGDRARVAAFGIVAAADKGPARARGFQMQPPRPTGGARPRV